MSLSASLTTAVTGLQTLQNQTRIVSGNVSNAQNPTYTRKIANLTTPAAEGYPQGPLISSVTRVVATEIQQDLYKSTADLGRLETQLDYSRQLAEVLDATVITGAQPVVLTLLSRFEDAWKQLEATPESTDLRSEVVRRGVELTTEIRRLNGLQSELQNRAGENLTLAVQEINAATVEIASLNNKIASQKATGAPIGDLEDLRDGEIARLADKVGIRTLHTDRGEIFVYTEGGVQLVGTTAQELEYDAGTNEITYAGSTQVLNDGFLNGSIRASLDYLDTSTTGLADPEPNVAMLQKFFNQLDSFAANLVTVINNAYDDPATGAVEQFFATPTANGEAGDIAVLAALQTTPANVDSSRAGDVQQAMRNTLRTAAQINRAADPNGLAIGSVNIFGIGNALMAYHARNAANNETNRDTAERLEHVLDQKLRNLTGVNIDDELAQLQVLQNNYAALANVLNSITQMFDTLVNIGR